MVQSEHPLACLQPHISIGIKRPKLFLKAKGEKDKGESVFKAPAIHMVQACGLMATLCGCSRIQFQCLVNFKKIMGSMLYVQITGISHYFPRNKMYK